MQYDIVYVLKNGIEPEELRYSLRSIEENFPHRSVWFYGGKPEGIKPDHMVEFMQTGSSKWERVRNSLLMVCQNDEITEDFFLFNDDFFVLHPVKGEFINFVDGTIERRINELIRRNGRGSTYSAQLNATQDLLRRRGCDTMNFAVHLPMLVNRQKALEVLMLRRTTPMFRSMYGNVAGVPYIYHKDMKIFENETVPDESWDYVSTIEQTFNSGKVGEWIRRRFPVKSRFEI